MEQNQFSIGNTLLDVLILLGAGAGIGWMAKRKSPEQIAMLEKEKVRQHELEVAQTEAFRVKAGKAANDATVAMVALVALKHDSFRKAVSLLRSPFTTTPRLTLVMHKRRWPL